MKTEKSNKPTDRFVCSEPSCPGVPVFPAGIEARQCKAGLMGLEKFVPLFAEKKGVKKKKKKINSFKENINKTEPILKSKAQNQSPKSEELQTWTLDLNFDFIVPTGQSENL